MRFTSQKIADAFKVSIEDARLAGKVLGDYVDPVGDDRFPETNSWIRSCFNCPRKDEIKMEALNELLKTHGVESITHESLHIDNYHGNTAATYLNTGETYSPTIILDNLSGRYLFTSWGEYEEGINKRVKIYMSGV